ncbi:MAG TPA: YtxH domain-containing protein [Ktedonobacteraceae bacterium]|nr:YtxH domain-containing protein [Ktedonobacteraceae bacterium]
MKFLSGLLLGLGIGVAAGLLLAPQSGEDTRAQLGEQSVLLRDRGLSDGLRSRTEAIRARVSDAWEQGREVYSRTTGELNDRYSKVRSGQI